MYKLMKQNGHITYDLKEFICDLKEDLDTIPINCSQGSTALIINTGEIYILNSQQQWKLLSSSGGESGNVPLNYKGSVLKYEDLPLIENSVGDMWYVENESTYYTYTEDEGIGTWKIFFKLDLEKYIKVGDLATSVGDLENTAMTQKATTDKFTEIDNKINDVITYNGAYPEQAMTETTATINPNTFYKWGEVVSLNISLAPSDSALTKEYTFEFVSGAEATTLTVPKDIRWVTPLAVAANKIYQVSILNNVGVIIGA